MWVRETTQLKKPAICSSSYQCSEHPDTLSCSASMDLVQWKIGWMKTMQPATALSALDHYIGRPTTPQFNEMTLLHYVCSAVHHAQAIGFKPIPIRNAVGVIVRPYFSPDPSGPKYEEYCRQKLIRPHQPVSTRLRIHRIRAHARPHNAVHSPSLLVA